MILLITALEGRESFAQYLHDIAHKEPISPDEEIVLAQRIRHGDQKARDRLVEANLRFVITVACEYVGRGAPLVDLVSAGNTGLIIAAEKFDETRGFKFITYAFWWIRQAIRQTIDEYQHSIRLPGNWGDLLRIINKTRQQMQQSGEEPDIESIAKEVGVQAKIVRDVLDMSRAVRSLDIAKGSSSGFDDERTLLDTLADENVEPPDSAAVAHSARQLIEDSLKDLKPREAEIIKLFFGLDGEESLTLEGIGAQFGLTRERIRQIKEKALQKLRNSRHGNHLKSLLPGAEPEIISPREEAAREQKFRATLVTEGYRHKRSSKSAS